MNPKIGRDIVSTGIVKEIRVEEDRVEIDLDVSQEDEFKKYFLEEIKERLEKLPNIKRLNINLEG